MLDLRPVGYVIGLLVAVMGATMVFPMLVDLYEGQGHWTAFAESALISILIGGLTALACANSLKRNLNLQQVFLLTTGVWVALPLFGALPFMIGATEARVVDAVFEAMSGMTTTGSTVFVGLDTLPKGLLLWRGMLQWYGGLGVVILALIFLPVMRVGGMQFFRSESFDTLGKALPRTVDISRGILNVYIGLTTAAVLVYTIAGMSLFDATVHAMTTISTGGFSTSDMSFAAFSPAAQYACVLFMILGSIPFVLLMAAARGHASVLFRDFQASAYVRWLLYASALVVLFSALAPAAVPISEAHLRAVLFNTVSIFSGTGYGSADISVWGSAAFTVLIVVGAIGGCTGSTGCSIKVFRYQVLIAAIGAQIRKIRYPSRIVPVNLGGKTVREDVFSSIIAIFSLYILTFGILSVALGFTGLTFLESTTGAWTAIFNIGPAFGPSVGPTGALTAFPDTAKWIMILGMLLGRLEIISVLVLFTIRFWRD